MRYPLGYFGFLCILTLIGACGWLMAMPLSHWLMYGVACTFFILYTHVRICSWRFVISLALSLMAACYMIYECRHPQGKARHVQGVFRFEKQFRTRDTRIGGFGQLMLEDGQKLRLYVHAANRRKTVINDVDYYRFSGYIKPLLNPFKSSQNFSFYLWSRFIRWHTSKAQFYPLEVQPPMSWINRCRQTFFNALTTRDATLSHIYRAILMGKKEGVSKEQLNHFFYTGTMHLFAVSGLHVGVVSAFLFFVGRLFFFPFCIRWLLTSGGVLLYGTIVGWSPSTLRATLMVGFVLLAQLVARPVKGVNTFFNTMGLTLLLNPFELWDVGFQLSYGTVASILCIGVPLSNWYARKRHHASNWQLSCIVSFCASAMSSLFSIYYWNLFSPWAFVANLFLIPLASVIVVMGMVSWGLYCILPITVTAVEWIAYGCLWVLLKSVDFLEHLPFAICKISMTQTLFWTALFLFMCVTAKPLKGGPLNRK